MKDWDFEPQFSDDYFQFQPPAGSDVMEFLVTSEMEANDE
jgi:outer membrane lipoprotein-sorting protein